MAESKYKLLPYWDGRHVRIRREKGSIPDALSGFYTDFASAEKAITLFNTPKIRKEVSAKSRPNKLEAKTA